MAVAINVKLAFDKDQLDHLANLIDGKVTKRQLTRAEVNSVTQAFWNKMLDLNVGDHQPQDIVGEVIEDINRGGWSFIGEPPGLA